MLRDSSYKDNLFRLQYTTVLYNSIPFQQSVNIPVNANNNTLEVFVVLRCIP